MHFIPVATRRNSLSIDQDREIILPKIYPECTKCFNKLFLKVIHILSLNTDILIFNLQLFFLKNL